MSYFVPYLDGSGLHLPSYSDRMEKLIADYKAIFGEDVYIEPDSMDYQVLSIFAKMMDDMSSVLIGTYHSMNPNYASGTALDALMLLSGLMRHSATRSYCELALIGEANAELDSGAQAIDTAGYIWEIDEPVTFDSEGQAFKVAYCTTTGAITAGVGTINEINTPMTGWLAVSNAEEATPGRAEETDAQARVRRSGVLALPAASSEDAIRSALMDIDGVTSVNFVSNDTDETDARGIPAHSISAVVKGGNPNNIVRTIWEKKAPGVGTYGSQTYTYTDVYGNVNTVKFERSSPKVIQVAITIYGFAEYDESLITTDIPNAIADYINSMQIGENLIVSQLYSVVYDVVKTGMVPFSITSISANIAGESASAIINASYKEKFISSASYVTVTDTSGG